MYQPLMIDVLIIQYPTSTLNQRRFAIRLSIRSTGDFGVIDKLGEVQQSGRDFIRSWPYQVRRKHESVLLISFINGRLELTVPVSLNSAEYDHLTSATPYAKSMASPGALYISKFARWHKVLTYR
jgi:hypothetical protein